jgi:hypothetical protein
VSAPFDMAPLCEGPIDLARTMDDLIERYLHPHLALNAHIAELFVLYGVGTHGIDIATHAPRLFLRSATPRCGKSTAIKVLAQFVRRGEIISEVSRSSLFHTIDETGATILLDEADESVAGHKPLFAVLHCGHDREGAFIKQMYRGVNTRFSTFAFIIFGCIGNLHPQLMDRGVIADMQRDNEGRPRFRPERGQELREIGRKFSKWVADNSELLAAYDPLMPNLRNDRAEDNWRLMIAIADLAGGDWPHRARAAAVHLSVRGEPEISEPETLVLDIHQVWGGDPPKIRSTDLAAKLRDMEGRPWSGLTPDRMAKILKVFQNGRGGQIKPQQLRFGPIGGVHGYERWQFEDAFRRYARPVAAVADQTASWPSLDEIAAAVEAVRAELADEAARDEAVATAPTTEATLATPEPEPGHVFGITPEIHEAIMKRMAEEQAQAEPPTEEDTPVTTPEMDVEFMEQSNHRRRQEEICEARGAETRRGEERIAEEQMKPAAPASTPQGAAAPKPEKKLPGMSEDEIDEADIPEGEQIGCSMANAGDHWVKWLTWWDEDNAEGLKHWKVAGSEITVPIGDNTEPKLKRFHMRRTATGSLVKGAPLVEEQTAAGAAPPKRGRGRPKGSKNKPKTAPPPTEDNPAWHPSANPQAEAADD